MMVEVSGEIGVSEVQKAAAEPKVPEQTTEKSSAQSWRKKFTKLFRGKQAAVEVSQSATQSGEVQAPPTQTEIHARMDAQADQENTRYGRVGLAVVHGIAQGGGTSSVEDQLLGSMEAQRRMDEAIRKQQEAAALRKVQGKLAAEGA